MSKQQRSSTPRTRPQKYQNITKFKNNRHDNSNFTKMVNSMEISGVCMRCKEQIEWRITFKKYKPLAAPKKCVKCDQKTVKRAYTAVCEPCGEELKICLKCLTASEQLSEKTKRTPEQEMQEQQALESELRQLPERRRRAVLRSIAKGPSAVASAVSSKPSRQTSTSTPVSDWLETSQAGSFSGDSSNDGEGETGEDDRNAKRELDIPHSSHNESDSPKIAKKNIDPFPEVALGGLSITETDEIKRVTFED